MLSFCCFVLVAASFATVVTAIPFLMKWLIDSDPHANVDSQLEKGLAGVDADAHENVDAQLKRKLIEADADANIDAQLKRKLMEADHAYKNVDAQLKRRAPSYSPADVFKKCHDGIAPIIVKIG